MPFSDKKILLVEDEYLIAIMAADMLTQVGVTVVGPVATVSEALMLIEEDALDCAVLDLNLRNETSEPVANMLRQKGIPVIYATGRGMPAGDYTSLEKPYTEHKLYEALKKAMA